MVKIKSLSQADLHPVAYTSGYGELWEGVLSPAPHSTPSQTQGQLRLLQRLCHSSPPCSQSCFILFTSPGLMTKGFPHKFPACSAENPTCDSWCKEHFAETKGRMRFWSSITYDLVSDEALATLLGRAKMTSERKQWSRCAKRFTRSQVEWDSSEKECTGCCDLPGE